MSNSIHGNLNQSNGIHSPYTWTWADETERLADTTPDQDDLDNRALGLQEDTNIQYRLTSITPITWVLVGGGTSDGNDKVSIDGSDTAGYLADKLIAGTGIDISVQSDERLVVSSTGGSGGASGFSLSIDGNMYVADGIIAKQISTGFTSANINWTLEVAPTGTSAIFELEYSTDGHTWSSVVDEGTIVATEYTDSNTVAFEFADNSFVRINCTQIGSTLPGTRLMLGVR